MLIAMIEIENDRCLRNSPIKGLRFDNHGGRLTKPVKRFIWTLANRIGAMFLGHANHKRFTSIRADSLKAPNNMEVNRRG